MAPDAGTADLPLFLGGPDGAVRWLLEHWEGDEDALITVLGRVPRQRTPAVLAALAAARDVDPPVLAAAVGMVWADTHRQDDNLSQDAWAVLFERAGYIVDGRQSQRPTDPVQLYRGSIASCRDNMSWTSDPAIATVYANFADRDGHPSEPGEVWTALVEPWRLYARITDRGEAEYVIDPRGLAIESAPRSSMPLAPAALFWWHDTRSSAQGPGGGLAGVLRRLIADHG